MAFKLTKDIELTGERKRIAIQKNAYLRPIVKSAVFDWKDNSRAIKFYLHYKHLGFKIYDASGGSDTWALYAIKNGNAKTLVDEGYYDPKYYGTKLVEIKDADTFL